MQTDQAPFAEAVACIDCGARPAETCEHCRAAVCVAHVQTGRTIARLLFGPFFMRAGETSCRLCYQRRLWLAWRGLIAVIGAVVIVGAVVEGELVAIPVVAVVVAAWWFVSGRALESLPPRG